MCYYLAFFFDAENIPGLYLLFSRTLFKGKWQHNIDNMIVDIMNI